MLAVAVEVNTQVTQSLLAVKVAVVKELAVAALTDTTQLVKQILAVVVEAVLVLVSDQEKLADQEL